MTLIKQASIWLVEQAIRVSPVSRRDWLAAMRSELHHVPQDRQLGFAAGAAWVAVSERTIEMHRFVVRPIDASIMLVAAVVALLAAANGIRLFDDSAAVAVSFSGLALVWSGVFFATLFERYRLLTRLACAGCIVALAIGLMTIVPAPAFAANDAILRALSIEGVVMFAALFGAAMLAQNRAERALR